MKTQAVSANYMRLWPSGRKNYLLWFIVSVGHENNWEWLKVPKSMTKCLSRKLIQLPSHIIFSKILPPALLLVSIEFLSSKMVIVLQISISFNISSAYSIAMMLDMWHIYLFWVLFSVIETFSFLGSEFHTPK